MLTQHDDHMHAFYSERCKRDERPVRMNHAGSTRWVLCEIEPDLRTWIAFEYDGKIVVNW
jgi:hypothetical protein